MEVLPARPKKTQDTTIEKVVEKPAEEIPTHEVVEGDNINLTIERPSDTSVQQIFLLRNDKPVETDGRLSVKSISPTTTEINLTKTKLEDAGTYSVQFGKQPSQKLMNLKVLPKPVIHDSLQLPKDVFDEGETLTIQCDFDKKPDENFVWKLNDTLLNIKKDDRILIQVSDDGKSYLLTIKDLKPNEHQGVYKLESPHLVLETPFVRVIEHVEEEDEETTILVEDEETESFELQRKSKKDSDEEKEKVG